MDANDSDPTANVDDPQDDDDDDDDDNDDDAVDDRRWMPHQLDPLPTNPSYSHR
jgi:hypothetical protein